MVTEEELEKLMDVVEEILKRGAEVVEEGDVGLARWLDFVYLKVSELTMREVAVLIYLLVSVFVMGQEK